MGGENKRFDAESELSTLPFEDSEEIDEADEEEDDSSLSRPRDIPSSQMSSSSSGFSFTEDHYNLLNGQIDFLTSTVEGLQSILQQVLVAQQALNSRFDMVFHPPHLLEN
ncbi:hypothetical protein Adt_02918 [Abeliophyllum distichum]|uniref:Uncharacterized protein n=1 Tax=Abeliophyllum distichum TaxID=126358 RepID=A0ABD1W0D4_9LAMI